MAGSDRRAEMLIGWWLDPKGLVIVALTLFFLAGLGAISDTVAATLLSLWLTAVAAHFVHVATDGAQRLARAGLSVATVAVMLVPLTATLNPGTKLLDAQLSEGGHVAVPSDVQGQVRVLVHADIAGNGAGTVDYRIGGFEEPLSGHLRRSMGRARIGRSSVAEAHVRNTEMASAVVGPQHALTMELARGAMAGPLHVVLYREWWPQSRELMLGAALLLAAVIVSLRKRVAANLVPSLAGVTAFGLLAYRWVTPDSAFRPELGALLVAGAIGAAVYVPWRHLVMGPHAA